MPDPNTTSREEQFLFLLRPIQRRAERYAMTLVNNREDAKDLLQDAIVLVWQHFDTLREPLAFKAYLFTVMNNVNKRQFRKRQRMTSLDEESEALIESTGPTSEQMMDATIVRKTVDELSDKAREAILLYEVHDLPVAEIAVIQQCSISAVKVRLMRARHTLAKKLGVTDDIYPQTPTPSLQ